MKRMQPSGNVTGAGAAVTGHGRSLPGGIANMNFPFADYPRTTIQETASR